MASSCAGELSRADGWPPPGRPSCRRGRSRRLRRRRRPPPPGPAAGGWRRCRPSRRGQHAAVAVAGVLAQADVRPHRDVEVPGSPGSPRDRPVGIPGSAPLVSSLASGTRTASPRPLPQFAASSTTGSSRSTESWECPGIEVIGRSTPLARHHEQREHEHRGVEAGLGHHAAQSGSGAQPAGTYDEVRAILRARAVKVGSSATRSGTSSRPFERRPGGRSHRQRPPAVEVHGQSHPSTADGEAKIATSTGRRGRDRNGVVHGQPWTRAPVAEAVPQHGSARRAWG
jgi:hypothetical protein